MNHSIIKLPVAELKAAIGGLTKVVARHTTLPVLGMIHVERDRQGWVHLTATDLDTFLSLRLEAPEQIGSPAKCLVPLAELQRMSKICPVDEVLDLEVLAEDQLLLRHRIGSHPVEQVITSAPLADFPAVPVITASSVSLDEAARATLLNALACASDDETRVILNGAYLDVSKPSGHYAVATDGRHLFASNSLHLALPSSVLVPDHRFLSWSGFVKDGQWKLSVQAPTKDKSGYLRLESRRWTFVTKQIEGTYPNWRNITEDVRAFTGSIDISDQAAEAIGRIVPRLPGDDTPNHTVGLYTVSGRALPAWREQGPGACHRSGSTRCHDQRRSRHRVSEPAVLAQGHRLRAAPDRRAGALEAPALQRRRQPPDDRHARAGRRQPAISHQQRTGTRAGQLHHPACGV